VTGTEILAGDYQRDMQAFSGIRPGNVHVIDSVMEPRSKMPGGAKLQFGT